MFHARVCALHRTHLSIPVAHQRQRHDGRTCPCERVFHAQVCALPLKRVFHARVCALQRTHLCSRSTSKTVPRQQGLSLLACVPRSGVCTPPHTSLYPRSASTTAPRTFRSASEERATMAGLAPASVCSTLGCAHTPLCSRSTSKTVPRRQGLPPASVCSRAHNLKVYRVKQYAK